MANPESHFLAGLVAKRFQHQFLSRKRVQYGWVWTVSTFQVSFAVHLISSSFLSLLLSASLDSYFSVHLLITSPFLIHFRKLDRRRSSVTQVFAPKVTLPFKMVVSAFIPSSERGRQQDGRFSYKRCWWSASPAEVGGITCWGGWKEKQLWKWK